MDGDDPMTGILPQGASPTVPISCDPQRQESLLLSVQAKISQEIANVQNELNLVLQRVDAVPAKVIERMANSRDGGESGWRGWFHGVCQHP
jgi:hypothetical protein